jgi:hypothetical protein
MLSALPTENLPPGCHWTNALEGLKVGLDILEKRKEFPNFRRVQYVVCFLLGNSPASEFYMPTFRNTLSVPSS